tara:strand:- start:594 stop:1496 length:903 start_codon:yes stop_codon:yes gene_type:complete
MTSVKKSMTKDTNNPYAAALDGLTIDDPVQSFFNFCKEREKIRLARESGNPPPWSDDEIFQKGRFLNVFREDDRGSRAILRFSKGLEDNLELLIQSLFFARWCNRQETLDKLSPENLSNPNNLVKELAKFKPWANETAYPVESVSWEGKDYPRLEAATELFLEIKGVITDSIKKSERNVIVATNSINSLFKMENDFPIFMAIIDIAWFRPDIISPDSPVPTGIGAVAYLDRLQKYLNLNSHEETCDAMIGLQEEYWPEARRPLSPIDIEYLSCECRKYYSYINGTKSFEGKNVFTPKLNS